MPYDPYHHDHYRFPRQQPLHLLQVPWRDDVLTGLRHAVRWSLIFWAVVAACIVAAVAYAGPQEKRCMTEALNARQIATWSDEKQPEAGVHHLLDRLAESHPELGLSPSNVSAQHDVIRRIYRLKLTPDAAFDGVYHECTRVQAGRAG